MLAGDDLTRNVAALELGPTLNLDEAAPCNLAHVQDGEDGLLRGTAARTMLAQDARWVGDALLSASDDPSGSWLTLMLIGHAARIVHEGSRALRSTNATVGVPHLASELTENHDSLIARARHAGKFLDDSKKSFQELSDEMASFYAAHRSQFIGRAPRFLRWLETDLGLCVTRGGRVLFSTISGQFRIGLTTDARLEDGGPLMSSVATEMGKALTLMARADGRHDPIEESLTYRQLGRLRDADKKAASYLGTRYDPSMGIETKLLLLMVEGEMAMSELVLPLTAPGHEEAVFRARMVSAYHGLRAVEEIMTRHPEAQSTGAQAARSLLNNGRARRLLDDPAMRRIRNRCMHYEIQGAAMELRAPLPMFGIVEALDPTTSFQQVNATAETVTTDLAVLLSQW